MTSFDVGIAGLGAMGSMAALALARRGRSVVGFDRHHPPHHFGSSHGESRIIREAYFEHPLYVPLVRRAYDLWARLERESGRQLLVPTGGVMLGPAAGTLLRGARHSALVHGLAFEELSAREIHGRFPVFRPGRGEVGLLEPRAGVLLPEPAIEAALLLAQRAGAVLRFEEPVLRWEAGEELAVVTASGTVRVKRLILAAGAWMAGDLSRSPLPLTVARQALCWFGSDHEPELTLPERMPIFIWEWEPERMFYGFPDLGRGVKIAIHHEGTPQDPEAERPPVTVAEVERLRRLLAHRLPAVNGPLLDTATCLYTNTPSEDFLIDRSPLDRRVILASPCSGHGFKFCPVVGEVLADLTEDRHPAFDLAAFAL